MQMQSKPMQNKRKAKQSKEKQSKAEEKKTKETIFADFASGDADLLSALQDFEAMRNRIKKPMTDQAKKRLVTELEKLAPGDRDAQIAILHQSEDHCWAGVFASRTTGPTSPAAAADPSRPARARRWTPCETCTTSSAAYDQGGSDGNLRGADDGLPNAEMFKAPDKTA